MNDPHHNLKTTPIPRRLLRCPRDHRGYIYPFLMVPGSQVTMDLRKQELCVRKKLCMICGQHLEIKKWFIGGHMTLAARLFTDPAMHEECARYALKVCPFLSRSEMKYRKKYEEGATNYVVNPTRTETTLLMRTNGFKGVLWQDHTYVLANKWDYIEHWRDGERVPDPPGLLLEDLVPGPFDQGGEYEPQIRRIT